MYIYILCIDIDRYIQIYIYIHIYTFVQQASKKVIPFKSLTIHHSIACGEYKRNI